MPRVFPSALFLGPLIFGCAPRPIRPMGEPHHVVVLPGILGHTPGFERIPRIIDEELDDASVQVWNWTRIEPNIIPNPIGHIRAYSKNRARAKLLADQLTRCKREHPDVRVSVVALSGGTAIALFACDELPDDVKLDRIVLLSAAVSPDYDVAPALQHVEHGVVNYWSPRDRLVLKYGTSVFGTADRVHEPSAGYRGFNENTTAGVGAKGLTQIQWHPGLWKYRNSGGHAGAQEKAFIRECVVEWLRGDVLACGGP